MVSTLEALAEALPIAAITADVVAQVVARNVVVEAPPGAGKTTVIPATLLERGVLGEGQIIVLQPRRIAARLSASRTAALLGEAIGERVGYRVRFEHAGTADTRLWFMTEGVLLRRLRDDPELAGVAAVILDEFHERHLDGDVLLALLRALQRRGRGLRLMVMSATLDAEPVARFLDAVRLRAEGRSFPVEIEHRSPRSRHGEQPLERRVAAAARELVERGLIGPDHAGAERGPGHALVFLPGAREIAACMDACAGLAEHAGLELVALHGSLAREQQDRAVAASARSRLILATNVAETSITIDGVRAVIDSGLARVADFDASTGLPRLSLVPIARSSAAQRAGRAGRTQAGVCIRLYSRHDHDTRPEHQLPEIRRLDLAGPVLELAAAGVSDPAAFPWLEAPSAAALTKAGELLRGLGALDEAGALTEVGRQMLRFPLHPRLARLLVAGLERGVGELAASAAALLAERPLARSGARGGATRTSDADILDELDLLRRGGRSLDPGASASVSRVAKQLQAMVRRVAKTGGVGLGREVGRAEARERALREALLAAHPDRVAKVRVDDHDRRTLVFAHGGSAELAPESAVRASTWVIALRSEERREGTRRRAVVRSACAIDPDWLIELFADAIDDVDELRFDDARGRVIGESSLRYGKLVIESSILTKLPQPGAGEVLLEAARAAGAARFCRSTERGQTGAEALEQLRLRAAFIHRHDPSFPALDGALVDARLAEACAGAISFAELEAADLLSQLGVALGDRAGDHRALDRRAPRHVTLAGGRRLRVHYEVDRPPWIGSRLQDFFSMATGPTVLDGRVALVMHLHAPNRHAVAVTADLAGFWRDHYPEIRRQLKRRYPKHDWPEDPT